MFLHLSVHGGEGVWGTPWTCLGVYAIVLFGVGGGGGRVHWTGQERGDIPWTDVRHGWYVYVGLFCQY